MVHPQVGRHSAAPRYAFLPGRHGSVLSRRREIGRLTGAIAAESDIHFMFTGQLRPERSTSETGSQEIHGFGDRTECVVKRALPWLSAALASSGCRSLESILYSPAQTPESWLRIQPFVEIHVGSTTILVVQPTTTAIVYLLGLVAIGAGVYFLRRRDGHRSRLWWGIALPLWGIGALLAGTSYEAFSYQIKCAGRAACLWTSWWEIGYLAVSAASTDAILIAQSHACATAGWRRMQGLYAITHSVLYTITLLTGALVPVPFLISFEFLLIVSAPGIVMLVIQNGRRYARLKKSLDLALLWAWAWLALTIAAYFLYLISGVTQRLWARQIWFSENDVLHIGLILWVAYLVRVVAPHIEDCGFRRR